MNDYCSKCGQGGIQVYMPKPIVSFNPLAEKRDSYCSYCGESLYSACSSCGGTGKKRSGFNLLISEPKYCSECGRALEVDDTCSDCGGTGEVYDSNHRWSCTERLGW